MPRPYSTDLRGRVLRAHEAGEGSQRVLAARFGVSVGAVCGWLAAARDEGRRGPQGDHDLLTAAGPARATAVEHRDVEAG